MSKQQPKDTVKIDVIGFEGPNRVGKGTQIERLRQHLEGRGLPCIVLRGNGSRPATGEHIGDPQSSWWSMANRSLRTTANLSLWQESSNRLAREFIVWRDFRFPKLLKQGGLERGLILVDRTILSQFMILRETGVTDWGRLYPETARAGRRQITGDLICPDIVLNLVAPKEVLLSRLDRGDPKYDFRRLLIETKYNWYLEAIAMLPGHIQERVSLVKGDEPIEAVFGNILDILRRREVL